MAAWLRCTGLLLALAAGCTPMTFSNEQSVDFGAYPSVSVEMGGPDGSERQRKYLVNELSAHSGFWYVAADSRDPASAQLAVDLEVRLEDPPIVLLGSEDDSEITYSADVHYQLFAADGHLIDSGADSVEDELTSFDAAESALDQVVLHYLPSYRL
jgi:hypothetical protein